MWLTCWISSISSRKDEIVVQIANPGLKRWRADHLPAMAPADLVGLVSVDLPNRTRQQLLEKLPGGGRGIEEEHPAGFGAGVLPRMSHTARQEGAGAWPADRDLVVDLEGDLTAQHVGDLVALVVKMEHRLRAGRRGFLERYHALAGFAAQQLERGRAAGRHAQDRPAAGRHHKAFCIHREDSFRCFRITSSRVKSRVSSSGHPKNTSRLNHGPARRTICPNSRHRKSSAIIGAISSRPRPTAEPSFHRRSTPNDR